IAGLDAAELEDLRSRPRHVRRVRVIAHELQHEICLYGGGDLSGPALVDRPATAGKLLAAEVLGRLAAPRLVRAAEEVQRQHVFGLEDRVALELAAPVSVRGLDRGQVAAGGVDGVADGGGLSRRRRGAGIPGYALGPGVR